MHTCCYDPMLLLGHDDATSVCWRLPSRGARTLKGERGILRGAFLGDSVGAPMNPRSLPAGDRAKGLSTDPAVLNLRRASKSNFSVCAHALSSALHWALMKLSSCQTLQGPAREQRLSRTDRASSGFVWAWAALVVEATLTQTTTQPTQP